MKKIFCILAGIVLATELPAQTNAPAARLAIVSESPDATAAADLLTVSFSHIDQVHLLERAEIEKVIREQQLSPGNLDHLKLGQLLGADGLLALQSVTEGTNQYISVQLVAVRPGVILEDKRVGRPATDTAGWADALVEHLKPLLPKLNVLPQDAIPLSVVNFHAGVRTAAAAELEQQTFFLTVERLVREKRIFVLERKRMQPLSEEKELAGTAAEPFWNGKYLLDGAIDRDGFMPDRVTINARLIPPGGPPVLIEASGSRTNYAEVVNQLAEKVLVVLNLVASATAWNTADEADKFFKEAQWNLAWGLLPQAQAAVESAWALGKQDEDCAALRIRSYLAEISRSLPGYNHSEHSFSAPHNADGQPIGPLPGDALLDWDIAQMIQRHPDGIAFKKRTEVGSKVVEYVHANGSPDPENLNRAQHTLQLYQNFSRVAFPADGRAYAELQGSSWYKLGVENLTTASEILKEFNLSAKARIANAEKLSELRALARAVAGWLEDLPGVRAGYFVGDRVATHDELAHTIEEAPNVYRCQLNWGCFWQEKPEDTIAVYRKLMGSPVFCYLHKDLWNRDLLQPRLVAWNEGDQKHIPAVWENFSGELTASTNLLLRMEAKALAWADASDEMLKKNNYEDLLGIIRSNRNELVANKVELFYLGWGLAYPNPELEAMDQEYWQKTVNKVAVESIPEVLAAASGNSDATSKTNLSPFEAQKVYLKANTPFEPHTFVKMFIIGFKDYNREQALEIKPLLADYKKHLSGTWARIGEMQVGQTEANVEHILNPAAVAASQSSNRIVGTNVGSPRPQDGNVQAGRPPWQQSPGTPPNFARPGFPPNRQAEPMPEAATPAPEPLVSTNIIIVKEFYPLPLDDLPGNDLSEFKFIDHQLVENRLVLDFEFTTYFTTYTESGGLKSATPKSCAGVAVFDPTSRHWQVAVLPEPVAIGTRNVFPHHTIIWRGALYSSNNGKVQKYDFQKNNWDTNALPMLGNCQLYCLDGKLFAADYNSIQQITGDGRGTTLLASIQRQPPITVLDSQGALMKLALFMDAKNFLCAAVHNKVFRWDGNNWEEIGAALTSFRPTVFADGVIFATDGFNLRPARISCFDLLNNIVETCLIPPAQEPAQRGYAPRPASADVVAKPLWKLPAELSLPNLSAACLQSDLFLMADHSEKEDIVNEQQHLIVGSKIIAKDGYNAALYCFTRDLPAPEKIRLKFNVADGCPPLAGIGSNSRPMIPAVGFVKPWMLLTTNFLFCGREQYNGGMPGNSEPTGLRPGIWAIPLEVIAAEVGALKQTQSDAVRQQKTKADQLAKDAQTKDQQFRQAFLLKYDRNHNNVIDDDEQDAAQDDPYYIKYRLQQIHAKNPQ